jgi:Relaxase/Mobilisation nuclease domain
MVLGRGFRGVIQYAAAAAKSTTSDHGGSVRPFFTNMAGSSPRELSAEFGVLRKLRPNLTKAVGHLILGHDPTQRPLRQEEWKEAIKIALSEHGASDALFASWQHHDTKSAHVHVIFSRVLTNNHVVSDSNSYRKNEAAARLIERKFMLDAPTPISAENRPGDRQALVNAAKRAERRGTAIQKFDTAAIRAALAHAHERDHFLRLLKEIGIEAEFDRRGQAQEIYGWRLRQIGAEEWLKASTVAKDLSWPKIAHRFSEKVETTAPAADTTPEIPPFQKKPTTSTEADLYSKAPSSIRHHLLTPPAEKPLLVRRTWDVDITKIADATRNLGPLTHVMAVLGASLIKYSLDFIRQIGSWLSKWLAKFFGINFTEKYHGGAPGEPKKLELKPYIIDVETRVLQQAELDRATETVAQIAAAVDERNPAKLPDIDGRDEIGAAMIADPDRKNDEQQLVNVATPQPTEPEAVASELDEIFATEVNTLDQERQSEPLADPDPIEALKAAVTAQKLADERVTRAKETETPQVVAARRIVTAANARLNKATEQYEHDLLQKPKALRWATPAKERVTAAEIAALAAAKKSLAAAQQAHPPTAPPEVHLALMAARQKTIDKGRELLDSMRKSAAATDAVLQKLVHSKASGLKAQVDLLLQWPTVGQAEIVLRQAQKAQAEIDQARAASEAKRSIEVQRALERNAPRQDTDAFDQEEAPR